MAKRKKKIDKTKLRAIIDSAYGAEPSFASNHQLGRTEYMQALNWYANALSREDSKDYVADFLRAQKRKDDLKKLGKVSPAYVTTTYGAIARMLSNGVRIPDTGAAWLNKNLQELFVNPAAQKEEVVTVKKGAPPVNIQTRIDAKVRAVAGEIDDLFEDNVWFDTNKLEPDAIFKFLHSKQVSGLVAEKVATLFTPHLEELKSINSDVQLKEAYRKYSKNDIKRFIEFYQNVVDTCKNFNANTKKTKVRKPRAKKVVSADKATSGLKYLKLLTEYQLASVNPIKLIGAEQAYIYNIKYRDLTVLNALDRGGLQIKGQSFINIDEKTTMMKKLSTKQAEEIVKTISSGGKRVASNAFNTIETARKPQLRMNEQTIILAFFA